MGGGLKNKAFTLIELLAIIVILAIIAVITVPIILNVIDNAKCGSVIDSAYGYKDAIDKYYITKLMEEDFELDDTYSVLDGKLGGIDIPISGMKPISGTLTYEDNELKSGCLTFGDHKVSYDGSKFTGELGTCPIVMAITYTDGNGVKYYNTEWIGSNPVYYNPVTGAKCDNYHEDNSKTGYNGVSPTGNQTSCLKWYAYSEQNGDVNLLLDHNTTAALAWVSRTDYNKSYDVENGAQSLGITYPNGITGTDSYDSYGNWNKGPITLLKQLKIDTEGWSEFLSRSDSYIASNNNNSETVIDRYTINYSRYKARIITAQEIAYITGNTTWDEKSKSSSYFYLDSKTQDKLPTCIEGNTTGCSYGWLYDRISNNCTEKGCLNNTDGDIRGYWTVSPDTSNSVCAWRVFHTGVIYFYGVFNGSNHGIRPVITVPKSSIFEG